MQCSLHVMLAGLAGVFTPWLVSFHILAVFVPSLGSVLAPVPAPVQEPLALYLLSDLLLVCRPLVRPHCALPQCLVSSYVTGWLRSGGGCRCAVCYAPEPSVA